MKNKTPFSDSEIIMFYNIIYYVETEVLPQKHKGYSIKKGFSKFCQEKNIELYPDMIFSNNFGENKNIIIFKDSKNNQVGSIFAHLRNSISHAKVIKKKNYFIFEDWNRKKLTMKACLKANILNDVFEALKSSKD